MADRNRNTSNEENPRDEEMVRGIAEEGDEEFEDTDDLEDEDEEEHEEGAI